MALIVRERDGRTVSLGSRTVVGRFPICDLPLDDRRVSGNHAVFRHDGDRWVIVPHVTTNGTFLDDVELPPGLPAPLREGAVLRFGTSSQRWTVVDLGPPAAVAIEAGGERRISEGEALALPDATDVQVLIVHDADQWWLDGDAGRTPCRDGQILTVADTTWTLHLPSTLDGGSTSTSDDTVAPSGFRIRFVISPDGDEIRRCFVGSPREERGLSVRRHTHLLLELAEAHADRSEGWVDDQVLMRRLSISRNQLHLLTHRAKSQLQSTGLLLPEPVIETRGERSARQLRLVCDEVLIEAGSTDAPTERD